MPNFVCLFKNNFEVVSSVLSKFVCFGKLVFRRNLIGKFDLDQNLIGLITFFFLTRIPGLTNMVLGKPVTKAMISWFIENQKIVKPRAKTETFFLVGSWFGQNILGSG